MKTTIIGIAILAMSPILSAESSSPWEFKLGGDFGTYDRSNYEYVGLWGGLGYQTSHGMHSIIIGVGDIENGHGGGKFSPDTSTGMLFPDINSSFIAYRYSYSISEKLDLFAELGAERLSWSETVTDAFGNPLLLGFEDTNYFFGFGAEVQVYENLYLTGSLRYYLSNNEVLELSGLGFDVFGNPVTIPQDVPDCMVKIGVVFKF